MTSTPVLIWGKIFESEHDALAFVHEQGLVSDELRQKIEMDIEEGRSCLEENLWGIRRGMDEHAFPSTQRLNARAGTGYFVGYEIYPWELEKDAEKFMTEFRQAQANWAHYFKAQAGIHHEVQIG